MDATKAAADAASICTPATDTHIWTVICCAAISFMLLRVSIDLVQTASQKTKEHFRESHHAAGQTMSVRGEKDGKDGKGQQGQEQEGGGDLTAVKGKDKGNGTGLVC